MHISQILCTEKKKNIYIYVHSIFWTSTVQIYGSFIFITAFSLPKNSTDRVGCEGDGPTIQVCTAPWAKVVTCEVLQLVWVVVFFICFFFIFQPANWGKMLAQF